MADLTVNRNLATKLTRLSSDKLVSFFTGTSGYSKIVVKDSKNCCEDLKKEFTITDAEKDSTPYKVLIPSLGANKYGVGYITPFPLGAGMYQVIIDYYGDDGKFCCSEYSTSFDSTDLDCKVIDAVSKDKDNKAGYFYYFLKNMDLCKDKYLEFCNIFKYLKEELEDGCC